MGRISILEMMPMTDALRSLVMKHATATDLRAEAIREGMVTDVRGRAAQGARGRHDDRGSVARDAGRLG